MQSVLTTCKPRPEILAGTFNPEIFTASLNRVLTDYRKGAAKEGAQSLYSDPVAFFREATYPTAGLRSIVDNALARLVNGDLSRPAMQRLDTAFGGGKTHTLIALLHAAMQGNRLAEPMADIVPAERLGEPGQIRVVGVIGDTVDTLRETAGGAEPKPNTLWWIIATQLLDESQREPILSRLDGSSSPASDEFFDHLFGDQPTLIIVDEIAQYLSRIEAAFPGVGAEQAAAFLMSLSTYAREKANLAVVISLASATNAFGGFNKLMGNLQSTHGLSSAEAEAITGTASRQTLDVVSRTSEATTPVTEGDLSQIMAKRLFISVDQQAAQQTVEAFVEMYRQAGTDLPSNATDVTVSNELMANYPFHPTLIAFLSQKLSQVETFQGTRGLLRTLARTVRRIWEAKREISLIQTGHIDLSDNTIRAELLGKTGNEDFQAVLDADVTKVAGSQSTARTVAGDLDAHNPHPEGYPVHEWSWRVVFLHSLIGRGGGLEDERYGIDLTSAVYEMASPAMKPATVRSALELIEREANYLRERHSRLYADTVPTLNNILRRIQGSVTQEEALTRIEQVVRGLIKTSAVFDIRHHIHTSEDMPDKQRKPQLGIVAFDVEDIDPSQFIERRGDTVREHQNLIFLLVPSATHIKGATWSEQRTHQEQRARDNVMHLARKAIAVERLKENPDNWNIRHEQLQRSDFKDHAAKRPAELRTAIDEMYRQLVFSGRENGQVVTRDIGKRGSGPAAGGSGGIHTEDAILKQLSEEGELITEERASTAEISTLVGKLFFQTRNQVKTADLINNFACRREWPILQAPELLAMILVQGAKRSSWCLGYFSQPNDPKPEVLYHQENEPPLGLDPLDKGQEWFICTKAHAKQIGWLEDIERRPHLVAQWTEGVINSRELLNISELATVVEQAHDKVCPQEQEKQLHNLLIMRVVVAYPKAAFDEQGNADPDQAMTGDKVPLEGVKEGILVPYRIAQERGWLRAPKVQPKSFTLTQSDSIKKLFNLLAGTGLSQSKTEVQMLQIAAATPDGGVFQLGMTHTSISALVESRQLFSSLNTRLRFTDERKHQVRLTLGELDQNCKFVSMMEQLKDT